MLYRCGVSYMLGHFRFFYRIIRSGRRGIYDVYEVKPLISHGFVFSGSLKQCRAFLRDIDPNGVVCT